MAGLNRKHFFNENYFEKIDTEQKAYWIGFFYADGHVNHSTLQCALQEKDAPHLQLFLNDIQANDVEIKYNKINNTSITGRFSLCSVKIADDLRKLGFSNRKSYESTDVIFQNIPDELKWHFIRGFWDGDGCIRIRAKKSGEISCISLNEKLLQSFCDYFNKIFNDQNFSKIFLSEEKYYRIRLGGEKAKKVCKFLYKNSTIYLDRKYQNYLQFKTYNRNYKGIRQRKNGRYQPYMVINGRQQTFGTYATIKEAIDVYNKAAIEYGKETQIYIGESLIRNEEDIL